MDERASVEGIAEQQEIALVEEGRADVQTGRVVTHKAVKAWVESLDTPWELPAPRSNGRTTT